MKIQCRYLSEEVRTARAEDPSFADDVGRIRARLARQTYQPERHHPDRVRRALDQVDPVAEGKLEALLEDWRGRNKGRWLSAVPRERSDVGRWVHR